RRQALSLELRRPGWGGDQATAHHLEAPAPVFDILIDDRGGSVGAPDSSSARNSASAASDISLYLNLDKVNEPPIFPSRAPRPSLWPHGTQPRGTPPRSYA